MSLFAAAVFVGTLLAPTSVAPEYVALGDSYAAGVGAGANKGACRRSANAHPALHGKNFPVFTFAACSGATAKDVIADQIPKLTPATTFVTVTVGGNDLGFVDVMTTCTLGGDRTCVARVAEAQNVVNNQLSAIYRDLYVRIRAAAPNADVVVVGYPRLFEPVAKCRSLSPVKRAAINKAADALNDVTAKSAAEAGMQYIDVRGAFAGHGVCAAEPWINGLVSPTSSSYHPNKAGQLAYLRALTATHP